MEKTKNILIVEDSDVVALLLQAVLEKESDFNVVGRAINGREAVRMTKALKPDLITMDIQMPVMDGFEATRAIMVEQPTPIVVVSSHINDEEMHISFRAIEEGALAVVEKPPGVTHPDFARVCKELIYSIRTMAGLRVKRRTAATPPPVATRPGAMATGGTHVPQIIAIGCSTGGPQALHTIIGHLTSGMGIPIVIVQHISKGFLRGMTRWVQESSALDIRIAEHNETLQPDTVYFAPDSKHLVVNQSNGKLRTRLEDSPPVNRFCPSATQLFSSVARACPGKAIGVLLTGMGGDGAEGLLAMHRAGCHTIVQDEASSVVWGMPRAAIELDAVNKVLALDDMADHLLSVVGVKKLKQGTA